MARHPPPIWIALLAAVLAYGAVSIGLVHLLQLPESFAAPGWLTWPAGGLFAGFGTALVGYAIYHLSLRRAFGAGIYAPRAESVLVTSGPYACVRNPLYLGATIALIGWTLLLRSVLLVAATVLMVIHFFLLAKWEERELRARLGERYEAYRHATPLFVPRFRSHRSRA